jgi:TetR/AcrR family tetracycline transcriptional repressor
MSGVHNATGPRARGAPPLGRRLSREAVVTRAGELIERDGLGGFSLRELARDLDVRPAALYNHVAGREELLDAVTARFIGDLALPDLGDGGWVAWTRGVAVELRRRFTERPALGELMVARAPDVEAGPLYQARVFAGLQAAGLSRADAHLAWHVVYTVVVGTAAQQRARGEDPADTFGLVLDVTLAGLAAEVDRGTSERTHALHEAHRHTHVPLPSEDPR